ncbi:unnamed protein product [Blepharisma stoltei]|uniref:Uncharacterized protein n=1 Tax=Blepharisma stoltei TaxID=1481888 RepID=A0AAU9J3F3_9CILI|nr:unnamed protein product [Blepharisma stoltei]
MSHIRSISLDYGGKRVTGEELKIKIASKIKLMQKGLNPVNSSLTSKVSLHNIEKAKNDLTIRKREFDSSISKEIEKIRNDVPLKSNTMHNKTPSQLIGQLENLDSNRMKLMKPRSSTVYPNRKKGGTTRRQLASFSDNLESRDYSIDLCPKLKLSGYSFLRSVYKSKSSIETLRKRLESCESLRSHCEEYSKIANKSITDFGEIQSAKEWVKEFDENTKMEYGEKDPEGMKDVKNYNKGADERMRKSGKSIREEEDNITTFIAGLGKRNIWKFATPSFNKKTEKLLNSMPIYRYGTR